MKEKIREEYIQELKTIMEFVESSFLLTPEKLFGKNKIVIKALLDMICVINGSRENKDSKKEIIELLNKIWDAEEIYN